jgi:16S rRNA processing protein RimM
MGDRFLPDQWIEIGTIVAPQGLGGQLRVLSNTDFPERFENSGRRWLQVPGKQELQAVELLAGRCIPGKNLYVIQLEELENREQAEALRGCKLFVRKSDRPQLPANEYHVSDLINLEVYNQLTRKIIGVVTDILWAGNDLLEVKLHQQTESEKVSSVKPALASQKRKLKQKKQKQATVLIPFVREIVPVVDLEGGRLEINPPPGLLEINE